jgi:hypothetical protein
MKDHIVVIHTDGGCRPNPGPGGWGAVLRLREHVREMCGGEPGRWLLIISCADRRGLLLDIMKTVRGLGLSVVSLDSGHRV